MKTLYLISIFIIVALLLLSSFKLKSSDKNPIPLTDRERQEIELAINVAKEYIVRSDSTLNF